MYLIGKERWKEREGISIFSQTFPSCFYLYMFRVHDVYLHFRERVHVLSILSGSILLPLALDIYLPASISRSSFPIFIIINTVADHDMEYKDCTHRGSCYVCMMRVKSFYVLLSLGEMKQTQIERGLSVLVKRFKEETF